MVRVRKLAKQVVRDEPLLWRLLAPFREGLQSASQLDGRLQESTLGYLASRRLMPGVYLMLVMPLLFVVVPAGVVVVLTHLKALRLYGPVVTWSLEGLLAIAVITRAISRFRDARRPAVEPGQEEFLLTPSDVEAQLASGQLRPFDLVHDGQVWNTLQQSPQFEFACDVPVARMRRRRRLVGTAKVVAWGTLLILYARWLFWADG